MTVDWRDGGGGADCDVRRRYEEHGMPLGIGDDEDAVCPSLTLKQRAIGFAICVGIGIVFSIISWFAVVGRNWVQFGIFATLGNLISIGGSCFLRGPLKQVKSMFEEKRLEATIVFVVSMVYTLLAALWIQTVPLVILMCIVQYLAFVWYGLSYIPFARAAVKKCFGGAVSSVAS
eukprot:TRINITY_DN60791_c0_g1_i1.p1 TRINITY_DN60791_c0_g1~~TRINITY_DN60791_c0_g1_i1.p1  ORF type:complete len:201 (+),score=69.75 TRINITY_DN60791_c0_g1_i1:81-605(+)